MGHVAGSLRHARFTQSFKISSACLLAIAAPRLGGVAAFILVQQAERDRPFKSKVGVKDAIKPMNPETLQKLLEALKK